jgi:Tfp pilus assembly protein PilF
MNVLSQQLLAVCKRYLGPAAGPFLHTELRLIGTDTNRIDTTQLPLLITSAMPRAAQLMGPGRAAEFRTAILGCSQLPERAPADGAHKLASDAAASLLAKGRPREAVLAYRELVAKHGDPESYRGLAKAHIASGDREGALRVLREGAQARLRQHDRAGELELLSDAVLIAPTDLTSHRRIAAAMANGGDLAGACSEYRRFVDAVLESGDVRRALLELAYGREILGELPELLALVDRVTARSAPERVNPVDEPRSSADPGNEPIDFQKAAMRRRFREPASPKDELEGLLSTFAVTGAGAEAAANAHMRASVLLAAKDQRAADAALDAARRLLEVGRLRAAADVLLAVINRDPGALDAHLLLADAVRRLGRPDIADDKLRLVGLFAQISQNDQAARAAASAASAASASRSTAPLVTAVAEKLAAPMRTA